MDFEQNGTDHEGNPVYLKFNDEQDYFWGKLVDEEPLARLRIGRSAALTFLNWDGTPKYEEIRKVLDERRADLLAYAKQVHSADEESKRDVWLLSLKQSREGT